jgi:hypothetical protein
MIYLRGMHSVAAWRLLVPLTADRVLAKARLRWLGWSLSFAAVHVRRVTLIWHALPWPPPGRERLKKGMLCW